MEIVSLTNEKETIVVQSQVLPKYRQIIKLVIGILWAEDSKAMM